MVRGGQLGKVEWNLEMPKTNAALVVQCKMSRWGKHPVSQWPISISMFAQDCGYLLGAARLFSVMKHDGVGTGRNRGFEPTVCKIYLDV